jgi:hypothetical protein
MRDRGVVARTHGGPPFGLPSAAGLRGRVYRCLQHNRAAAAHLLRQTFTVIEIETLTAAKLAGPVLPYTTAFWHGEI